MPPMNQWAILNPLSIHPPWADFAAKAVIQKHFQITPRISSSRDTSDVAFRVAALNKSGELIER